MIPSEQDTNTRYSNIVLKAEITNVKNNEVCIALMLN